MMKIGIIGLGEVGRCYAQALHAAGYRLGLCDARPAPVASDLAQTMGLPLQGAAGDWLRECDWVFSCVTGAHALDVAKQCLAHMRQGSTLCDLTTASPDAKRSAAEVATAQSIGYLDVAIMGAISLSLEKTPLLVSGPDATEFAELLAKANGNVSVIEGGVAGDAIALKILRSVFTKGMEALSVELLMAAEAQGVREKLYAQLRDIDETPLRTFIDMLVRTHVIHARRRTHEVHEAAAEIARHGLSSVVLPGVEHRFARTIAALDVQPPAQMQPTVDEALAWLLEHTRQADRP